jgi:hypothetical protein
MPTATYAVIWTRSSLALAEKLVARWDDCLNDDGTPAFRVLGKRDGKWLVGRPRHKSDEAHGYSDFVEVEV